MSTQKVVHISQEFARQVRLDCERLIRRRLWECGYWPVGIIVGPMEAIALEITGSAEKVLGVDVFYKRTAGIELMIRRQEVVQFVGELSPVEIENET